jgi:hypothetical protein
VIAKLLKALVMGSVPRYQFQAILQSERCDHRICSADGLAGSIQVPGHATRQFSGGLVEKQNLFGSNGSQEVLQAAGAFASFGSPALLP